MGRRRQTGRGSGVELCFVSLFVDDLARARRTYERVLGQRGERAAGPVPIAHPYSPRPPVVFTLGNVRLALFQTDGAVTHEGDVGLGLTSDQVPAILGRAGRAGCAVVPAQSAAPLSLLMTPDRHFFELVARPASGDAASTPGRGPRRAARGRAHRTRSTPTR